MQRGWEQYEANRRAREVAQQSGRYRRQAWLRLKQWRSQQQSQNQKKKQSKRAPLDSQSREIQQSNEEERYAAGGGAYARRNDTLQLLGFATYGDYLQSDIWAKIRGQAWKHRGNKCWLCRKKASDIHHNSYCRPQLEGVVLDFLYPLCASCHEAIEYDGERKRSLPEVVQEFWRRRKTIEKPPAPPLAKKPKPVKPKPIFVPSKPKVQLPPKKCAQCQNCCKQNQTLCGACLRPNKPTRAERRAERKKKKQPLPAYVEAKMARDEELARIIGRANLYARPS